MHRATKGSSKNRKILMQRKGGYTGQVSEEMLQFEFNLMEFLISLYG